MALSGVLVTCAFVGGRGLGGGVVPLAAKLAWSQKFAANAPGTTTQAAPSTAAGDGVPHFEIRSSVEIVVSYGAAPDAAAGPVLLVPANETRNVFCNPGDKLAWALAT